MTKKIDFQVSTGETVIKNSFSAFLLAFSSFQSSKMKTNNQRCRSTLMLVCLQQLLVIFTTVQYILFGTERRNSGRNRLNRTQKLWNKTLFCVFRAVNPKAFPVVLAHLENTDSRTVEDVDNMPGKPRGCAAKSLLNPLISSYQ